MKNYHISPFYDHLGKPWYWGTGGTGEQPKQTKPVPYIFKCNKCDKNYGTEQGLKVHKWSKHK